MKKTLVLLAALVAFTGSAFGQQYYNISPKYIYEHQTMDSTHVTRILVGNGTAALPSIAGINDPNTGMRFPGTDTLAFSTGGSERMRIDNAGLIIGTITGSGNPLTVSGNEYPTMSWYSTYAGGQPSRNWSIGINDPNWGDFKIERSSTVGGGPNVKAFTVDRNNNIAIGTTPPTSFGTSAAGVLGIGAGTAPSTSPADMSQIWTADRAGGAGQNAIHWRTEDGGAVGVLGAKSAFGTALPGTATLTSIGAVVIGAAATDTTANAHLLRLNNGGSYSEIDAGETAFANTSDENMKENITPINTDSIYALVRKMNYPRKWQYKASIIRTQSEIDRINEATSDNVVSPIVQTRIDSLIKAKATGTFTVNTTQVPYVGYKKAIQTIKPEHVEVGLASMDVATLIPADTTWKDIPETTYVARYDTIYTCSDSKRTQIQNSVLASQQVKAMSELATYEARIAKDAARPHVSVMAQDMYPVSRLMKGAAAKETTLSGDDLINALLIAVKKQDERIGLLEKRVSDLEVR